MREHATPTPTCTIIPFPVKNPRPESEAPKARSLSQDDDTTIDINRLVAIARKIKILAGRNPAAFEKVEAYVRRHYNGTLAIVDGNWKGVE